MEDKIVLLFGSFNPVTKAHVETLTKSMEFVGANKGVFIPTSFEHIYSKMIKTKGQIALSNELRLEMLNSVCELDDRLSVCTYEMDNSIVNNTKGTVEYLIDSYPNSSLYYTCGDDKLKSFGKWKNIEEIFNNVKVIVFKRGDISINNILDREPILNKYKNKFYVMDNIQDSFISSTNVRELFLKNDYSYKDLLPANVGNILSRLNPNDYKKLPFSEWIKLMHKYGGMHGPDISLKELYLENKKIINNKNNCDVAFYTSPIVANNIYNYNLEVTCVNSDIISEYNKLLLDNYTPVIINVCNRVRPCGKYDMGYFKSIVDEEEMCRISNLSNYLYQYGPTNLKSVKECGQPHKVIKYPLNRDSVLYCKDVDFFRNTKNDWYTLLDKDVNCDVILIPSISLRENETGLLKEDLKLKNNYGSLGLEGKEILKESIINGFNTALINDKDSLILTDLGIRSYYLKEEDVLEVLNIVLKEYKNKFKKIVVVLPFKKNNYYKKIYEHFMGE